MAIVIHSVLPGSLAAEHHLQPGTLLNSINGHPIRDFLDLEFYGADSPLLLELTTPDNALRHIRITRTEGRSLGIEPEAYQMRECDNSCVFCFIDQMPPGLRQSLYTKDDDYLYSFVFGNYITLSNLREADYQRILDQRINPLYISLHTTNNSLRKAMMRYSADLDVMKALLRLSRGRISFHLQIVCVPGYNDGLELEKTLNELLSSELDILSIGIVPVGLTRFRKGLSSLTPFSKDAAAKLLEQVEQIRCNHDSGIVYPADEFYVMAQRAIPEADFYDDYPQLENGIGMLRLSLENFRAQKRCILKELRKLPGNFLCATSASAFATISSLAGELNRRLENQKIIVQAIRNDFLGEQISVSGLITFADLKAQLHPEADDTIIIPGNIFNHEGETLDGADHARFKAAWQNPIVVVDPFFEDWDRL
ncbi:MAG: DUF512 domain-containing protein [Candidatus Cloacimonetes bacterium]|nr:DUF512 domain-containing protein [Candidatus Cloacimonadota bacterium]